MITKETAIEAIQEKLQDLSRVNNSSAFYTWKKTTIATLKRIVPHNVTIFQNLQEIDATFLYTAADNTPAAKAESKIILEQLIKDIERFGLETEPVLNSSTEKIALSVNQFNTQNQTTNISISLDSLIEILKEELRSSEIEELKEILESKDEPKIKKKNFMDKIKSFGSDVASNILANLLTNTQVFDKLNHIL